MEKRNYSHAYVKYLDTQSNFELISQASHGSVNLCNSEVFAQSNTIVEEYKVKCTELQFKNMLHFIHSQLGVKYSYWQLVLIFIKKLTGYESVYTNQEYICSEWAQRLLNIAGYENKNNIEYITPSDLHKIASTIGEKCPN